MLQLLNNFIHKYERNVLNKVVIIVESCFSFVLPKKMVLDKLIQLPLLFWVNNILIILL